MEYVLTDPRVAGFGLIDTCVADGLISGKSDEYGLELIKSDRVLVICYVKFFEIDRKYTEYTNIYRHNDKLYEFVYTNEDKPYHVNNDNKVVLDEVIEITFQSLYEDMDCGPYIFIDQDKAKDMVELNHYPGFELVEYGIGIGRTGDEIRRKIFKHNDKFYEFICAEYETHWYPEKMDQQNSTKLEVLTINL